MKQNRFKPITRIKKILEFYRQRGTNKELVNNLYIKIINDTRK